MKKLGILHYVAAFNLLVIFLVMFLHGSENLFTLLNGGSAKTFIENNDNDNNIYLKQFKKTREMDAGKTSSTNVQVCPRDDML